MMEQKTEIRTSWDGDLCISGNHYSLEECKEILKKDEWDDEEEINKFKSVQHIWIRCGFVCSPEDGEVINGWNEIPEPKNKKGCKKATMLVK